MGSDVTYESPEPRDLYQEAMDTTRAVEDIAPRYLALRQQYSPAMISQNLADQRMSLFGTAGGTVTEQARPTRRFTSGADFNAAVAEKHPQFWAAYQKSPHKREGKSFKFWLKEHSENPKVTNVNPEEAKLAAKLATEGIAEYAEGEAEGQTVTRTIEAQEGLLGGPDAYRYDEQGNERGMAQRVDAYARDKTRQDFQAQRRGDIQDLRELAPQAREAYMAANPEVASRLAQVNRMAERSETRGPSALASYATGAAPQAATAQAAPRSALGGRSLQGQAYRAPQPRTAAERSAVAQGYNLNQYDNAPYPKQGGTAQMMPIEQEQFVKRRIPRQAGELPSRQPVQRETVERVQPTAGQQASPKGGTYQQPPAAQPQQSATAQGTAYAQGRLSNDVSGLQRELESQAQQELAAGSTLAEREKRNLQEASRSAYAGRGLERSNRALLGEMQNRIEGNRQRLAERRAFAAGVSGQGEMMRRGRLQDTMNAGAQQFGQMATAEQLRMAQDSQDQAFALNALNASRVVDPSQAILGRGLTASNAGAFQQTAGSGIAANQMNMNPFTNQYASSLNAQNYQGALAGAQGNMMADYYNQQNTMDMIGTGLGFATGNFFG